jgi:hypothetical protein
MRDLKAADDSQHIWLSSRQLDYHDWEQDDWSNSDDTQHPTTAKPNELFSIDAPGFDPTYFKQHFLRWNFREYLQWYSSAEGAWKTISPYSYWYCNMTGDLPSCSEGSPNNHGSGSTSEKAPNTKPVADAATDQTATSGAPVQLDASASSDDDNDTLTYKWTQTAGPSVTLSDDTAEQPTFTAPTVQEQTVLTFELKVKDGTQNLGPYSADNSESDPDSVNITVNPAP